MTRSAGYRFDLAMKQLRTIIVMGVSGSGKTSVGRALAARLGWLFVEGDSFHPTANIEKMARGEALTDEDRWPWLRALRAEIERLHSADERCVMACSALRRPYRDKLRMPGETEIGFVHLAGADSLIRRRMGERDHFMQPGMLESQLATLETPGPDEAVAVGIDRPVPEIVDALVQRLGL